MSSALQEKPYAEETPKDFSASVVIDNRYLPPPEDHDGKLWVRTSALIQADAQTLYALWRDLGRIPTWQEQIVSVVPLDATRSRWTMQTGDTTVEWTSEILADVPGKRIAWHSIEGEPQNAGEAIFEDAPGGRGTMVTVLQEFGIGKIASALATFVGRNPKQAVIENIRHFKALAETGEIPRSQPGPHGDRGVIGGMKKSLYGEKIPTPPAQAS